MAAGYDGSIARMWRVAASQDPSQPRPAEPASTPNPVPRSSPGEVKSAAVEKRQPFGRAGEQRGGDRHQQRARAMPPPSPYHTPLYRNGPAGEAVGAADQFHHLDFGAAVRMSRRIVLPTTSTTADAEQRGGEQHDPPQHVENGVQALTQSVSSCTGLHIRPSRRCACLSARVPSGVLAASAGVTIRVFGSGLSLSASSAAPKPE